MNALAFSALRAKALHGTASVRVQPSRCDAKPVFNSSRLSLARLNLLE